MAGVLDTVNQLIKVKEPYKEDDVLTVHVNAVVHVAPVQSTLFHIRGISQVIV